MSGRFPKPATPSRGDGSAFIKDFGDPVPTLDRTAPPEGADDMPNTATARRRPAKPSKIAMTYKHQETHYRRLKRISQALEIPMGELIDEALEAKFPQWEAELAGDPR